MKIRLSQLRRIIKEEVSRVLENDSGTPYPGSTGYQMPHLLGKTTGEEAEAIGAAQSLSSRAAAAGLSLEQQIADDFKKYPSMLGNIKVRQAYFENLSSRDEKSAFDTVSSELRRRTK
jgi:hypothetical protein